MTMVSRDGPRIDLEHIEATARAAQAQAPGPYTVNWLPGDHVGIDGITDANGDDVVIADSGVYPPRGVVAEHIAGTSPEVVLELVRTVRSLRAGLDEALDAWRAWAETETQSPTLADDPGRKRIVELRKLLEAP